MRIYSSIKPQAVIKQFVDSGIASIKCPVDPSKYKNTQTLQNTYSQAIRRNNFPVKTHIFEGSLHLVRLSDQSQLSCENCALGKSCSYYLQDRGFPCRFHVSIDQ